MLQKVVRMRIHRFFPFFKGKKASKNIPSWVNPQRHEPMVVAFRSGSGMESRLTSPSFFAAAAATAFAAPNNTAAIELNIAPMIIILIDTQKYTLSL